MAYSLEIEGVTLELEASTTSQRNEAALRELSLGSKLSLENMSSAGASHDMESRTTEILVGTVIPSMLASIVVIARLYSRAVLTRSWGGDDTWISISWILGVLLTILHCTFVLYGAGYHQYLQSQQDAIRTVRLSYISRIVYQIVLGTTKLGICAMYLRVFQDRRSRLIAYGLMAFICAFTLPLTIYVIIQCIPPANDGSPKAFMTCQGRPPDLVTSAVCNVAADLFLLAYIVPRVFCLKIALRQKFALMAVAFLSLLVVVAAILRLLMVFRFNNSTDHTWDISDIATWSAVEVDTGLFCASAPAIRPLIRKWTPGFLSSPKSETTRMSSFQQYKASAFRNHKQNTQGQRIDDAIELESRFSNKRLETCDEETSKFWRPIQGRAGSHMDDNSIEGGFLVGESTIEVTTTISIVVGNKEDPRNSTESTQSLGPTRFGLI